MRYLFFLLGVFSTLVIFKFKTSIGFIYPVTLLFVLSFFVLIFQFRRKRISRPERHDFFYIGLLALATGSIGISFVQAGWGVWFQGALKAAIGKWMPLLILVCMSYHTRFGVRKLFYENFIKGFFTGVGISILFTFIKFFFWYVFKVNLLVEIENILPITVEHSLENILVKPILRVTGFHWDPAYAGLWLVMLFFSVSFLPLKYKLSARVVSLVLLFLTFSRTAWLAFVFTLVALKIISRVRCFRVDLDLKKVLPLTGSVFVGAAILLAFANPHVAGKMGEAFFQRFVINKGTARHIDYFWVAPKILLKNPRNILSGYGYRNAGRAINENEWAFKKLTIWEKMRKRAWNPESDHVSLLLSLGVCGILLYLFFFWSAVWKSSKMPGRVPPGEENYWMILLVFFLVVFSGGATYRFFDNNWYQYFILCYFMIKGSSPGTEAGESKSNQGSEGGFEPGMKEST